jgi:hypothetical protein
VFGETGQKGLLMDEYQNTSYQDVDETFFQEEVNHVSPLGPVMDQAPVSQPSVRENWIVRWSPVIIVLIGLGFALVVMYGR